MKLQKIIKITGIIKLETGLHIGMGNQEIHIGGIDNPVIKHPISNEPYIPGSSIKGKLRTLLEYELGKVSRDGAPFSPVYPRKTEEENRELVKKDEISRIFGSSNAKYSAGPTRLIVRDCPLTGKFKKRIDDFNDEFGAFDLYEGKFETAIDRISGTARRGSLRQVERVISGTEFALNMSYKVFDEQDEKNLELIKTALKLLVEDTLGGSGSRGYGKIRIDDLKFEMLKVE